MTEICFIKHPKVLVPADDMALDVFNTWKLGAVIHADYKQMRNGAYFRKWWVMVNSAYEYWSDTCEPMEYKGKPIQPNLDRFRRDLTILAGHYVPVWNIKGEMRIEPESLKWASMSEERFDKLYQSTFLYLLREVFNGKRAIKMSESQLSHALESLEQFG